MEMKKVTFKKVSDLATWPSAQRYKASISGLLFFLTWPNNCTATCTEHAAMHKSYYRCVLKSLRKHTQWIVQLKKQIKRADSRKINLSIILFTLPKCVKSFMITKIFFQEKSLFHVLFLNTITVLCSPEKEPSKKGECLFHSQSRFGYSLMNTH